MERGCEGHFMLKTPRPRAPTDWTFGGNMNKVRFECAKHLAQAETRGESQAYFGVTRTSNGGETIRRYNFNLMTVCF
jgi:hypothetical protein